MHVTGQIHEECTKRIVVIILKMVKRATVSSVSDLYPYRGAGFEKPKCKKKIHKKGLLSSHRNFPTDARSAKFFILFAPRRKSRDDENKSMMKVDFEGRGD